MGSEAVDFDKVIVEARKALGSALNAYLDKVPDFKALQATPAEQKVLEQNGGQLRLFAEGKRVPTPAEAEIKLLEMNRVMQAAAERQKTDALLQQQVMDLTSALKGKGGVFDKNADLQSARQAKDAEAPIVGGLIHLESKNGTLQIDPKAKAVMGIPKSKGRRASDEAYMEAVDKFIELYGVGQPATYQPAISMPKFCADCGFRKSSNTYRSSIIDRLCKGMEKGVDYSEDVHKLMTSGVLTREETEKLKKAQENGNQFIQAHRNAQASKLPDNKGPGMGAKMGQPNAQQDAVKLQGAATKPAATPTPPRPGT